MGLAILVLGLMVFLGPHVFTAFREPRGALIARLGEANYKIGYSILSVIGIALIATGFSIYRSSGWIDVWFPPLWTRHLVVLLIWPSIIMIAAAYSPGRIKTTLKHPFLTGIKLWAVSHLLANGDLGSIILFGSILAYAVFDRITLKRRVDSGSPPIAIGGLRNDVIAVVAGTVVYLFLLFVFHPYVVGVRVL